MITVIGNMKGGTGKSTIAFNLAVWLAHQNKSVRVFDLDPQQTFADVLEVRYEEEYEPAIPTPESPAKLDTLTSDHDTDEIIIDASMSDQTLLKKALKVCDRVIIPVAPSQADIWSTQRFIKLIKETCKDPKSEVLAVINRADTHPLVLETKESEEALDFLPGLTRVDTRLYNRTAYRRSFSEGLGVFELSPASKASKEFIKLAKKVF